MSEQCRPHCIPLDQLKGAFVEPSRTQGALRWLQPGEDTRRARGLRFNCPAAREKAKEEQHGTLILFEHSDMPTNLQPPGRYHPVYPLIDKEPRITIATVTIKEKVKCPYCTWQGYVSEGKVYFK